MKCRGSISAQHDCRSLWVPADCTKTGVASPEQAPVQALAVYGDAST